MATTPRPKTSSLGKTTVELAVATPQVVGRRLMRMARAGPVWSADDLKEFTGMVTEKPLALTQAWWGMAAEGSRLQWQWWMSAWDLLSGVSSPAKGARRAVQLGHQAPATMLSVLHQGLKPIHRKAVANARRLRQRP